MKLYIISEQCTKDLDYIRTVNEASVYLKTVTEALHFLKPANEGSDYFRPASEASHYSSKHDFFSVAIRSSKKYKRLVFRDSLMT